jgi:hypothetical protein
MKARAYTPHAFVSQDTNMTTDNTTNKYKATFEVPAMVRIEIEVDAANQQDGLVTAHDLIHQALPSQAVVVSLSLAQATNVAFERMVAAPEAPLNPLEVSGRYRVEMFAGLEARDPIKEISRLPFGDAKEQAERVLQPDCEYGSSQVTDEFGIVVLRAKAPRGGFEVHAYGTDNATDALPSEAGDRLFTWLPTMKEAKMTALTLLKRADIKVVRLVDYTDREVGPRVVREIR